MGTSERLAAGEAYSASGYVVCDELGAAVNPEWYSDEFHRVRERAGVRRIRLHDGRHTVNSLMAAAGVPPHIRAAWCGPPRQSTSAPTRTPGRKTWPWQVPRLAASATLRDKSVRNAALRPA